MYHSICFLVYWLFVCGKSQGQPFGEPKKDPTFWGTHLLGKQPFGEPTFWGNNLLGNPPFEKTTFWGTHLFKSRAGSLLKEPPNKDSKTLVRV